MFYTTMKNTYRDDTGLRIWIENKKYEGIKRHYYGGLNRLVEDRGKYRAKIEVVNRPYTSRERKTKFKR